MGNILSRFYIVLSLLFVGTLAFANGSLKEQKLKEIDRLKLFLETSRGEIKVLIEKLQQSEVTVKQRARIESLISEKHNEYSVKKERLNVILKALSYDHNELEAQMTGDLETLQELEVEVGIDREITSLKLVVQEKYRDFLINVNTEKWKKKKKKFFKKKRKKDKIILVE